MCTELGLNMCTRTGIKHVYLGVQGACPRQAVTSTGGMARACEGRAVGAGLKLVKNESAMRAPHIANEISNKGARDQA